MYQECIYCSRDERLDNVMLEICTLQVTTLYLFKEQSNYGRCMLVLNEHQREIFHLPEASRNKFTEDMCRVAQAIEKAFQPDKVNYGIYGDTMPHLHVHLVPKYRNTEQWGSPFELNPRNVYLTDDEYQATIERLVKYL